MFSASKIGKLKTQPEVIAFSSTQKVLGGCATRLLKQTCLLSSYVSALTPKVSTVVPLLLRPLLWHWGHLTAAVEVDREKPVCIFMSPTLLHVCWGPGISIPFPFPAFAWGLRRVGERCCCQGRTASAAGLCWLLHCTRRWEKRQKGRLHSPRSAQWSRHNENVCETWTGLE